MTVRRVASLAAALALCGAPVLAAERLTDRDVKALVDRLDDGRDKFEGALDDDLKHTVVRSATGEFDVRRSLDDFQQSVERLKERAIDADLKKDTAVPPQARQSAIADADQLAKDAKALRERVKDGKPSSAELERVQAGSAKLQAFFEGKTLPTAASVWGGAAASRAALVQAYGTGDR